MRSRVSFLVFSLLLSDVLTVAAQDHRALRGAWVAESVVLADGTRANGRGIAILLDSTYSFVAEKWLRKGAGDTLTNAEKVAAFDGFLASSGSYKLVRDTLTTRAYIHLDPIATRAWPNRTRSYRIQIKGDTLIWHFGGGTVGRFRRLEDGSRQR